MRENERHQQFLLIPIPSDLLLLERVSSGVDPRVSDLEPDSADNAHDGETECDT